MKTPEEVAKEIRTVCHCTMCTASLAAAIRADRKAVVEECLKIARDECVDAVDSNEESDYAYNEAINHVRQAIRTRFAAELGGENG